MKSLPINPEIKLLVLALTGVFVSCTSSEVMEVRQYHLNSIKPVKREAQMVRGEQMYRLRGAVTIKEQKARLGQYYTVSWKNDGSATGPLKIVMDYQQAATGSKVLRMSRDLPAGQASGRVEFNITGEAYRVSGRVLAWRIRMLSGDKVIAEERSYLWR